MADLRGHGLELGPVPMASATTEQLATFAVLTGGTLTGLAAVLRVFFNRHQHRSLLIEKGGTSYHLQGMSATEMAELIDGVLERALDAQNEADELWDDLMGPGDEETD